MDMWIAITDGDWFRYLAGRATDGRLDEVNFWSPTTVRRLKNFGPGEPVFLRLKSPTNAIAGYGFFAHFDILEVDVAWRTFGDKNGARTLEAFLERIGHYRKQDAATPEVARARFGCTVLR